jgi:hypothetical protein
MLYFILTYMPCSTELNIFNNFLISFLNVKLYRLNNNPNFWTVEYQRYDMRLFFYEIWTKNLNNCRTSVSRQGQHSTIQLKQSCDITKYMVPSFNICTYTNKYYISFEISRFGVQYCIIIKDYLIYTVNLQLYNNNNKLRQ